MKRVTVSLPDELAARVRAAAGEGQVSAYVAAALEDYQQRESLAEILADWARQSPVPDAVRSAVEAEMEELGMTAAPKERPRRAG